MKTRNRRMFLKQAASTTAAAASLAWGAPSLTAAGANERLTIGVIGLSRGRLLAGEFAKHGVKIAYLCDVDQGRLAESKWSVNQGFPV